MQTILSRVNQFNVINKIPQPIVLISTLESFTVSHTNINIVLN